MVENDKEYAEYLTELSKVRLTMLTLLSGFTFSTITILLNQLPNPQSLVSQLTLLFLTFVFDLLIFLLGWQLTIFIGMYSVRNPPPRARSELTYFNLLLSLVFVLWGLSLVLMYLLWGLNLLAFVSAALEVMTIIALETISRHMRRRLGWSVAEELRRRGKAQD